MQKQKKHKLLSWIRFGIWIEAILLFGIGFYMITNKPNEESVFLNMKDGKQGDYIKWVDFNVSYEALCQAYEWDVSTYGKEVHLNWIELLAYTATKNGGTFKDKKSSEMDKVANELIEGKTTMKKLTKDSEYYEYYLESYTAVLGGFVGEYEIEVTDDTTTASSTSDNQVVKKNMKKMYGLKAFLPIAKNFPYSDYDDFGSSRNYGYARPHLGHDMMGQVGTPIVCVESGYVEAIGWNQYGGWRIGIRSFDGQRYYYYAHMRQNYPYVKSLEEGSVVTAGDIIGYMGHTGYSTKENVNNITETHLHWGLQLIFDESQKEGNNEIWVDCYQLTRFLYQNRSEAAKINDSKEWGRINQMIDPAVVNYTKAKDTKSGSVQKK